MLNFLKGKLDDTVASFNTGVAKFKTRETAEAIVAIMTGVSFADGAFEPEERKKMVQAFTKHQILSQFDFSVLKRKHDELVDVFDLDIDEGLVACLRELQDVVKAPQEQREAILRAGVMLAKADGEFEEEEKAFLRRCAKTLGLDSAEYGL